jgi:HEAT repeat protein
VSKHWPYVATLVILLAGSLAWIGCAKREKTTPELIADLKSPDEKDRVIAARLLSRRKADAPQTVPALANALKDSEADIRWSAAIGLGYMGDDAKEAVPALQAALKDRDARVREAAGVALNRIDPTRFAKPSGRTPAKK